MGLDETLELAFKHVATTERLTLLIETATGMVDAMGVIHDADSELAPELSVAMKELSDCVQALVRAHRFSKARLEVALGNG